MEKMKISSVIKAVVILFLCYIGASCSVAKNMSRYNVECAVEYNASQNKSKDMMVVMQTMSNCVNAKRGILDKLLGGETKITFNAK